MRVRTRLITAALVITAAGTTVSAQTFKVGRLDVGPTIGVGSNNGALSIGGRIEKAFKDLPSLGNGVLGISGVVQHYSWSGCGFSDCSASWTVFGGLANYHFKIESATKWDPFIGLGLGYGIFSTSAGGYSGSAGSGIRFIGDAGVRYYFKEKMAAYADVGSGTAALNLGLMFTLH